MEQNWNLLGKSYVEALRRIAVAKALDADALRDIAYDELAKAKMRVQYGGHLWSPKDRKATDR